VRNLQDAGITVHTNTTITSLNRDTLITMPSFVRSLGLDRFSMNMVIPAGSSRCAHPDINVRYREMPDLLEGIQREARDRRVEFMWYSPTPVCIFNPVSHQLGNKGCAACDGLLSVSPAGEVLPCSSWPEPVGSLLDQPFGRVWHSVRASWVREKLFAPESCRSCEHFPLCQGGCPLYFQHFGFDELHCTGGSHDPAIGAAP
jgi:radical SAM protein with 4Fe4S-binding SPASM domain